MTSNTGDYWWLVFVLLLGVVVAVSVWIVQRSTRGGKSKAFWRYLLIWPILLDYDAARSTPGKPRAKSVMILLLLLIVVAVLAIVFTPPKTVP